MKNLLSLLLIPLFLNIAPTDRTIKGTVTDKNSGEPLIGATVYSPTHNIGAATDVYGKFSLAVPENLTELTVKYIGYQTKKINIKNKEVINIKLSQSNATLDEVVITGKASVRETKSLGYAVQSISASPIKKAPRREKRRNRPVKKADNLAKDVATDDYAIMEVEDVSAPPLTLEDRDEAEEGFFDGEIDSETSAAVIEEEPIAPRTVSSTTAIPPTNSTNDDGGLSIRGARASGTVYYIDGVKIRGKSTVPNGSNSQIEVITSGTPAEFSDKKAATMAGTINLNNQQAEAFKPAPPKVKIKPKVVIKQKPTPKPQPIITPPKNDQPKPKKNFSGERYENIYENDFRMVAKKPLSTFSIDVDKASYSNMRRFINNQQLPPPNAVRIEELVNYFKYDYPQPKDEHPFAVFTDVTTTPWNAQNKLVHIGIKGKELSYEEAPASNLVFLIDVSGSMSSYNKLPLLQKSFNMLVDNLREKDRVAIVVYAGAAGTVLPSTTGFHKEEIKAAINRLKSGGSTAGGAGIKLAYKIAQDNFVKDGNNRVILATDGDFNVGVSNDNELVKLIEQKRTGGVFLTVLGFGTGNYQDARMEKIADHGNGNYAYIDNYTEAKKVLVKEMNGTLYTIAKDVKIQIEFNPAHVKAYRLIGYENRMLKKEDFDDDTKDAGELGAGHTVTALYEIVPADGSVPMASNGELKYQEVALNTTARSSDEMITVKLRYKQPDGNVSKLIKQPVGTASLPIQMASENLRFASSVAAFGMLLRHSKYRGEASFESVIQRAKASKGADLDGYRAEFIRLVETADLLSRE